MRWHPALPADASRARFGSTPVVRTRRLLSVNSVCSILDFCHWPCQPRHAHLWDGPAALPPGKRTTIAAVQRPTMKFVAIKSTEQLDLQALHRARERSQRTGIINQIRAFLLERGIAILGHCDRSCRSSFRNSVAERSSRTPLQNHSRSAARRIKASPPAHVPH